MRKTFAALAVVLAVAAAPQQAQADDYDRYCVKVLVGTSETGFTEIHVCFDCYYPPDYLIPPLPTKVCPPV